MIWKIKRTGPGGRTFIIVPAWAMAGGHDNFVHQYVSVLPMDADFIIGRFWNIGDFWRNQIDFNILDGGIGQGWSENIFKKIAVITPWYIAAILNFRQGNTIR